MATQFLLGTQRDISVKQSGYAYDIRPGSNPEDWGFTLPNGQPSHVYQWPMPSHVYRGNKKLSRIAMPSPITLLPAILHPDWERTIASTGPFARPSLMEFNQTNGVWEEWPRLHVKDWVFINKSADYDNPSEISSIRPVPRNAGISINFCAFGPALGQRTILSISFGATTDARKFTLNINADGKGYLSRGNNPVVPLAEGYLVPNRWADIQGRWYKFFILPIRRNRILFSSSTGGSFVWENPDIPNGSLSMTGGSGAAFETGDSNPTNLIDALTELAAMSIRAHQKVAIQPNIMTYTGTSIGSGAAKFAAGVITTLKDLFTNPRVPDLTQVAQRNKIEFDLLTNRVKPEHVQVGYTTYIGGGGPAFQQNPIPPSQGIQRSILKPTVTLKRPDVAEEDKYHTPIFYRAEPSEPSIHQVISASYEDVMPDVIEFTHNQEQRLMAGNVKLKNGHNHGILKNVFNIPFQYKEEGNVFLEGVITKPNFSVKYNQQFIGFDLQDLNRWLDNTTVQDINRLDGLALDDAVKALMGSAGCPVDGSKWDIDPTPSFVDRQRKITKKLVVLSKGQADDEPTNLTDYVKTVSDWLSYLVENYTSASEFPFRWVYGFRPYFNSNTGLWEYRFFFKNPDLMTQETFYRFYATTDAALNARVANGEAFNVAVINAYQSVHQNFTSYLIEPEANALLFVGMDDTGNPIMRYLPDNNSIDGSLAYANQPANWLGEKRMVVVIDSSFNTPELVTAGLGKMFSRISRTRQHIDFDAQWEPRLRLWDKFNLQYYLANGTTLVDHQFRVTGLNITHKKDSNPGSERTGIYRNVLCHYQAERWYDTREA